MSNPSDILIPQQPASLKTVFLDQPPSCLEFCPGAPDYFVIGTYLLSEEKESSSPTTQQPVSKQHKTGSVQLFKLETTAAKESGGGDQEFHFIQQQRLALPHAVFDLHFSPRDPTLFATVSSDASICIFRCESIAVDGNDDPAQPPHISFIREIVLRDGVDGTSAALYFSWFSAAGSDDNRNGNENKRKKEEEGVVVSFSDGSVSVFHIPISMSSRPSSDLPPSTKTARPESEPEPALRELRLPENHDSEVWYVATSQINGENGSELVGPESSPPSSSFLNVFSGDDFGVMRSHTLALGAAHDDDDEDDEDNTPILHPSHDKARFHTAGITAILPLQQHPTDITSTLLLTGSYDEYVRVYQYSSTLPTQRRVLAETHLGGGVWRLQLLPGAGVEIDGKGHDGQASYLVLASCMHAGSRVLRVTQTQTQTQTGGVNGVSAESASAWEVEILAEFTEHESMNYASGAWQQQQQRGISSRGERITCVSSSFYDRRLCVWQMDTTR